jgi:hypothetical protein
MPRRTVQTVATYRVPIEAITWEGDKLYVHYFFYLGPFMEYEMKAHETAEVRRSTDAESLQLLKRCYEIELDHKWVIGRRGTRRVANLRDRLVQKRSPY